MSCLQTIRRNWLALAQLANCGRRCREPFCFICARVSGLSKTLPFLRVVIRQCDLTAVSCSPLQ